ncbi:BON domain-containing protein [Simplicispira suum]|uniref:Transporter n=1 Tax=Simplicispira suum TaxID=2109915 RepID=A0A2S0N2R7_9BURK|nr:BON domain-containing protein [Simplicispira suum]AVO42425.1 transporter [Simplicispira suum]MBW7831803.1 BON domain-containing protein [Simplicispira suum]
MNNTLPYSGSFARISTIVAVTALSLGLAACDKAQEPPTAGQRLDSAIQKTDQAAEDAKIKAEQALQATENKLDQGAAKVESAAQDAGASIKSAANSAAALADDASITARISAELAKDPDLSAIKIDVDTKAGAVRLSGPAPSEAAKDRATSLAKSIEGVTSVNNELVVGKS